MWTKFISAAIVSPLLWLSRNVLWKVVDTGGIDGTVNGIASGATAAGDTVRHTQSGNTRSYAVWVVVGAILVFAHYLLADRRKAWIWRSALMLPADISLTVLIFFPGAGRAGTFVAARRRSRIGSAA